MKLVLSVSICLFMGLFSCQNIPLKQALEQAGVNRKELEQVLEHYKDDSLKWKAALFLLENVDAHFSYQGKARDSFYYYMDKYFFDTRWA